MEIISEKFSNLITFSDILNFLGGTTNVDINYNSGEYTFEIKHRYYEDSPYSEDSYYPTSSNSYNIMFKTITDDQKLHEYSYYHNII